MSLRASTKCLSEFLIIFLICPKPSQLSVPRVNQQEYYRELDRSSTQLPNTALPTLRGYESAEGEEDIQDDNPGLNITDEQIRKFKLWENGVVPYYIDYLSFADKVLRDKIRWFLNLVNSLTSLDFAELPRPPKSEDLRWVFFVNRRSRLSCADHSIQNFTNEGVQPVTLGYDCMSFGGELAEAVLAIIGVPSQHNSPDRDDYIEVLEENIIPEKLYLFDKLKDDEWLFHDVSYDFESAGHFDNHKYSANGRATIKIKNDTNISPKKPKGLSNKDVLKIKMLYNYITKTKKQMFAASQCNKLFVIRNKEFKNDICNNSEEQLKIAFRPWKKNRNRKRKKYAPTKPPKTTSTKESLEDNITKMEPITDKCPENIISIDINTSIKHKYTIDVSDND